MEYEAEFLAIEEFLVLNVIMKRQGVTQDEAKRGRWRKTALSSIINETSCEVK